MEMDIDTGVINHSISSLSSTQSVVKDEEKQKIITSVSNNSAKALKEPDVKDKNSASTDRTTQEKVATEQLPTERMEELAEKLQEFVGSLNKGLEFSVHEESGRDVIKVIDRSTKEVVRQYPSEEVLELVSKLSDAAGNFINSKV